MSDYDAGAGVPQAFSARARLHDLERLIGELSARVDRIENAMETMRWNEMKRDVSRRFQGGEPHDPHGWPVK